MKMTVDYETCSEGLELTQTGSWKYSKHPTTNIYCMAFKIDDKPTDIWCNPEFKEFYHGKWLDKCSKSQEDKLINYLKSAEEIEAHNVQFEKNLYHNVSHKRHGWPLLDDKWTCSMSRCAKYTLPKNLSNAARTLGLHNRKDDEGHRVMLYLSKPQKVQKKDEYTWRRSKERFDKLFNYCIQDVETEYELSNTLYELSLFEKAVWGLDQKINYRGFSIDLNLAQKMISYIKTYENQLLEEFRLLTGLDSVKQVQKLREWLIGHDCDIPNLRAETIKKFLETTTGDAKRALEIRQLLGLSSVAKIQSAINMQDNGRIYGSLIFRGTTTGRWTGTIFQPQNLPRGVIKDTNTCVDVINNAPDLLPVLYQDPLKAISSCIRSIIIPQEGYKFYCGDFKSIEAVTLPWVAGETDQLEIFKQGKDPYIYMASKIFKKPYDQISKDERFIGKIAVLALGYQGGIKAFDNMAKGYGVIVDPDVSEKAVKDFRETRPLVKQLWYMCEKMAKNAIKNPGKVFRYRRLLFGVKDDFLMIKLPSGRYLYYYKPRIEKQIMSFGNRSYRKSTITYLKNTVRKSTYGGKITENIIQAIANCFLVNSMFELEKRGYNIILTVHDEVLCEVKEGFGSLEEFKNVLSIPPKWAKDFPLKGDVWEGMRYRK